MRTYSVSDASQMLNVNEETIRRWIRDGKLTAKRAVGRGGNTILLEDIVAFANKPPRAYLLSLEAWLKTNDINYQKIEDPKNGKSNTSQDDSAPTDAKARSSASMISAAAALATASSVIPFVGPVVAATAVTTAVMKRKNYQSYSIQLVNSSAETTAKDEKTAVEEATATDRIRENSEHLPLDGSQEVNKRTPNAFSQEEIDAPQNETAGNAIDILDEIAHAKKLLDAEIITQEEFTAIKARLIAKI